MRAGSKRRTIIVRVKTGCVTCKIRRVKCDEAKPACLRCTRTGRKCDGYEPADKENVTEKGSRRLTLAGHGSNLPLQTTHIYSIPFQIPGSQNDRQLLHYYCVHASKDVAGFSIGSSEFWSQFILQRCHVEPVVLNAVIAVASIHRDYVTKEGDIGPVGIESPTIREYNRALRKLRKYLRSPNHSIEVVLVCCTLFYCFDAIRGECEWAFKHLQTGIGLFRNWVKESDKRLQDLSIMSDEEPYNPLILAYLRLDMQATTFDDARLPALSFISHNEGLEQAESITPYDFKSLSHAQTVLDKLQHRVLTFLASNVRYKNTAAEELPEPVSQELQALKEHMRLWQVAFDSVLERTPTDLQTSCKNSVLVLGIRVNIINIMIASSYPSSIEQTGGLDGYFRDILSESDMLVSMQLAHGQLHLRSWSSESSIVMPLFLIVLKCSDSQLRSRALALLAKLSRREGLMDGDMMASIAKSLLAVKVNGEPFKENKESPTL
ncbi:hypothetical protein F5884DRAFT_741107 [Xylogone sp. PMI_703]|nr:hypothetical protein F5884DRAFT_741107 [Xylogone sp. PMI_703]